MEKTETNELLGKQKNILDKLNKQHQLLLTADGRESEYDDIRILSNH